MEIKKFVNFDGVLDPDERKKILHRLNSVMFWVGSPVPDEIELDGQVINLRDLIHEYMTTESLTQELVDSANALADRLEDLAKEKEAIIAKSDITEKEAMELMDEAAGILRGVDDLRSLKQRMETQSVTVDNKDSPLGTQLEHKRKLLLARVNDQKRWKDFLGKVKTP